VPSQSSQIFHPRQSGHARSYGISPDIRTSAPSPVATRSPLSVRSPSRARKEPPSRIRASETSGSSGVMINDPWSSSDGSGPSTSFDTTSPRIADCRRAAMGVARPVTRHARSASTGRRARVLAILLSSFSSRPGAFHGRAFLRWVDVPRSGWLGDPDVVSPSDRRVIERAGSVLHAVAQARLLRTLADRLAAHEGQPRDLAQGERAHRPALLVVALDGGRLARLPDLDLLFHRDSDASSLGSRVSPGGSLPISSSPS